MTQLIPVQTGTIGNTTTLVVDARELHQYLELKWQFSNWIQLRIKQYEFTQDADYSIIKNLLKKGAKPSTEYTLTLDMAKELAMVERNEKGREARRYFIECEKKLHQQIDLKAVEQLKQQNEALKSYVLQSDSDASKLVRYRNMGLSQREIAKLVNKSQRSVGRIEQSLKGCGLIAAPATSTQLELVL